MYLVLNTQVNGGNGEDPQTNCAVVTVDKEMLDYWLGTMDQAAGISDKLGKTITLVFHDWSPECYADYPMGDVLSQEDQDALDDCDPGYVLLETEPFPGYTAVHREETWINHPGPGEPVALSYCEVRVSATTLSWWYGPKYGDAEEYTYEITRQTLEGIVQTLTGVSA